WFILCKLNFQVDAGAHVDLAHASVGGNVKTYASWHNSPRLIRPAADRASRSASGCYRFSRCAASLTMLRSECAFTSKLALTKPRVFVMSTFFCSASRFGNRLGSR